MAIKEKYLSVTQAAERAGVSRAAVYQAIEEKRLPAEEVAGRFLIREQVIDAWTPMTLANRRGVRIGGQPTPPGKTPRKRKNTQQTGTGEETIGEETT